MSNGGVRLPIPVRATNANDYSQSRVFPSLGSAAKFAKECGSTDCQPDRSIKRVLNTNSVYAGYYWSSATAEDVTNTQLIQLHESFPMLFDGKTTHIRVTSETPRRVSVFDLIEVITGVENPSRTFHDITARYPEVLQFTSDFMFPGQGQRMTPVTDARGVVRIVNKLHGPRAILFRETTADILVRYLGGDESLIAEIRANNQLQASLPQDHPMRIFGEAVEVETPRYALTSPSMEGKYLCDFIGSKVVYLVTFSHMGQVFIKFGKSENCTDRMESHYRTYPNSVIYCIHEATELKKVEDAFKAAMKYRNKIRNVTINGRNFTEIVTDISLDEAEDILMKIVEESCVKDDSVMRLAEIRLREKELDIERARMIHQIQVIDMLVKAGLQGDNLTSLIQKVL